ncbi:MAG: amidase [Planctomycetales bacterium]|nr:amidase [Planctomycetales bacterium]
MLTALPTIAAAASALRRGALRPLDLVEFCLSRIERFEPRVHAWVLVDAAGARAEALRQEAMLRAGQDPGPLAGIPLGIKDIIDVAGWPTRGGSTLRDGHVAHRDATLVGRLREAGAIILGKTVTAQFACFDPPLTRNPWNEAHTPGGSSSGSAAAVAMEMCMAAIGTQTGGSIIRPASYCGVVGLKPSWGQVPLDGVIPVSYHLDHAGPLARCVGDAAAVYAQLRQSGCQPVDPRPAEIERWSTAGAPPLQALDNFFFNQASPPVQAATRAGLQRLPVDWGTQPLGRLPNSFGESWAEHRRIMAVEAAEVHRRQYAEQPAAYGPHISGLLDTGLMTSAVDYAASLRFQREFQRDIARMFDSMGIAVMPATNCTAPGWQTTGDPKFNSPWSLAGVPSITIPGGLTEDGLPWGLQLVGPHHGETQLIQAAAWCERHFDCHLRPV